MTLLVASLVPLLAGPLLVRMLKDHSGATRALDTFVLVSMGGLIVLHILPHSLMDGGVWALLALGAGLLLPLAATKLLHAKKKDGKWAVGTPTFILGVAALAVHAMVDGVALVGGHEGHVGQPLAFAVVLHRVPVGLAIWWLVRPRLGLTRAILVVTAAVLCTLVGYFLPGVVTGTMSQASWAVFTAFVTGALVHVLFGHRHGHAHEEKKHLPAEKQRRWSMVGGLVALVVLAVVTWTHPILPHLFDDHYGNHDHHGHDHDHP